MNPALIDDGLDPVIFAKGIELTNEFNLQSVVACDLFRVCTRFFAPGIRLIRIVEDLDLVLIQVAGHAADSGTSKGCKYM